MLNKSQQFLVSVTVGLLLMLVSLVLGDGLAEIPSDLTFDCSGRPYGYYADPQADCQVFHICLGEDDIKWSFLCPNQTIFNQQYFVCDYTFNVDCLASPDYYNLNENFGIIPERDEPEDYEYEEEQQEDIYT